MSLKSAARRPDANQALHPFWRIWQGLYRSMPNFRGKGRVLWQWPASLVRSWPTNITIMANDGSILCGCDLSEYLYQSLFFCGFHEMDVDWMCRRLLGPGDVFLDIGACFGCHTLTAARLVQPNGRVYAIEPQPDMFAALSANLRCNGIGNVDMENLALSDRAESVELHRFPELGLGHTSVALLESPISGVIPCEAVMLDDLIAMKAIQSVTLAKLDVEGAELKILRGSQRLLRSASPPMWIIEMSETTALACGYKPRDLLSFLSGFGYQAFRPVWGKGWQRIKSLEPCPAEEIHDGQNLLCAVPSAHGSSLARVVANE
jgi:FkbM family methyltransferase